MARFSMDLPILGVQRVNVESKIYAKVFVGEEPDGETEQIASIMSMNIRDEHVAEVFAATASMKLGQIVRIHVETARGGKQTVKNEVLFIEPIDSKPAPTANQPAAKAN